MKKINLTLTTWIVCALMCTISAQKGSFELLEYSKVDTKVIVAIDHFDAQNRSSESLQNKEQDSNKINVFVIGPRGQKMTHPIKDQPDLKSKSIELNTKFWEPGLYKVIYQSRSQTLPLKQFRIQPYKRKSK